MIRGHDADIGLRDRERMPGRLPVVQQLCDAEIKQFRNAGRGHQDIGGLKIAMHDQILMSVVDRAAYRLK